MTWHCCASKAFPVTTEPPSLGWNTILNSCICVRMSVLLQIFEVMDEVTLNSHIQVFVGTKLIYLGKIPESVCYATRNV